MMRSYLVVCGALLLTHGYAVAQVSASSSTIPSGEYRVKGITVKLLSEKDLAGKSATELHFLRNEIFWRRGHKFKKPYLKEYFELNSRPASWTSGYLIADSTGPEQDLNEKDHKNLQLIDALEKAARLKAEASAKLVPPGYENEFPVKEGEERCFKAELIIGKAPQIICIARAPAAEFSMPIIGINWDYQGMPADLQPEKLKLVDIDKLDKYREIVIRGSYPQAQPPEVWLFGFDGSNTSLMGKFQWDLTENTDAFSQMNGGNRFTGEMRSDLLLTWYYHVHYRVDSNHRVVAIPEDVYKVGTHVKVKVPLPIQRSKTDTSTVSTLQPGDDVELVSSDAKEWFQVRSSNGKEGWFAVDKVGGWDIIRGLKEKAYDVFDGLHHSD